MQVVSNNTFEAGTQKNLSALESMGLKPEWLTETCFKALAAFNQATPYDALGAAGSYAYFAAVRAIREALCSKGWHPIRQNNLEITKSPVEDMAIIVSSGNKNTGDKNKVPKTKNHKGRQTQMVIYRNQEQLQFWENSEAVKNIELGSTWILLYHIDLKRQELRMELSLPTEIDLENLKVNGWNTRIILPSINFGDPVRNPQGNEYNPEPEIKIIRRNDEQ